MTASLLSGHRPRSTFSDERVPINIAPEARDRLNTLLSASRLGLSCRACLAIFNGVSRWT